MKKYYKWIIVLMFIGAVFMYRSMADQVTYYYFYDNENGYYDEIYDYMDSCGLAPSQEKLEAIATMDGVEGIYPSIGLETRTYEGDWEDEIIEIDYVMDGKEKVLTLPKKCEVLDGEMHTFFDVNVSNYSDEQYIVNQMGIYNDNALYNEGYRVTKTFDCDSGVYISGTLFAALGGDQFAESLSITIPLYVPTKMKVELMHHETLTDEYGIPLGEDKYDFYAEGPTITDYQRVNYTFDVQGVVKDYGLWVFYPIEITQDFINLVDKSEVVLNEGEIYFQPNTYQVKLEKEMSMKSLGKKMDDIIDNFALEHPFYRRRMESYTNREK